ncbi:hypothetical protein FD12_GL002094 [Lentilactobacillus rapi DSM 19907 = JCM 15042]|uniref:Uncharacterized protein n=1 Tax=Lentilactobacillus rapi DSM 19907 = JCM 15042 TaxID=1423795 RepID=A0ABR5PI37_9LACO|nr:hypothetical protein [Lentilactobacillus rapi]KRL18820.1 hypothetical protein FD12_GL002094 [Lentilactobacillus rapi DSM 19907 = JCM 15042]
MNHLSARNEEHADSSKSDFFDNLETALTVGSTFAGLAVLLLFVAAIVQFSWRRKIEN